jgi:adenylate cyclase
VIRHLASRTGVLALIALLVLSHIVFDRQLDGLRGQAFDIYQQLQPRTVPDQQVVVVGIDDDTIAAEGRWPWPRDRLAELISAIHSTGVTVLGVDILFSEADTDVGGEERDRKLAAAIASGPTVLATSIGDFPSSTVPQAPVGWSVVGHGDAQSLPVLPGIIASTPLLREGASGLGIVRSVSDEDGTVRSVPMVWASGGGEGIALWPAFSMELARLHLQAPSYALRVRPEGYEALKLGDGIVPLTPGGAIWLWEQEQAVRRISALEVFAGKADAALKGKIAILSVNALGIDKFHTTPVHAGRSGADIHAVLAGQLLDGVFLSEPAHAKQLERGWFVFSAIMIMLLSSWLGGRLWLLIPAGVVICLLPLAAGFGAYLGWHTLYEPLQPAAGLALVVLGEAYSLFREADQRRRQLSRQFSQYLSPNVVDMLTRSRQDLTTSAEKREITVLMMDMRGFTSSSEQLPAEEIIATVNRFLTLASAEIFRRDGTIDKFMGDAILAFWNAPVDQPDHAARALQAVLAIRAALDRENQRRTTTGKTPIEVGAGMETGICSVGNFGSDIRFDYTAIGSSVNMAARLESATKITNCPVLLGPGFATRHPDGIEPVGLLELAGFSKPVGVFCPEGMKPGVIPETAQKKEAGRLIQG